LDLVKDTGEGLFGSGLDRLAEEDFRQCGDPGMELLEALQFRGAEARQLSLSSQVLGQALGECGEGPGDVRDGFAEVDALAAGPELLIVLGDEEVEVVVLGLSLLGREGALRRIPLVESALAQVLAPQRVDEDHFGAREGIVADLDAIAAKALVHAIEAAVELDIGELLVDRPLFPPEEVLEHGLQVDLAHGSQTLLVALTRRLAGFVVGPAVVAHLEPGREGAVELVQGEDIAGSHLRLELTLRGSEEALDEAARWRVPFGTVAEPDVQGVAGALERAGVVDLGVVDVELGGSAVGGPTTQKAVDEDVQVLAVVVAALHDGAAVAVDEGGEVGEDDVVLKEDVGPLLEIANPQGVGVVPAPAATHRLFRDPELQARGPRFLEVAV